MFRPQRDGLRVLAALLAFALLLSASAPAPASPQRGEEERSALYQKFLDNYAGGVEQQKVAHEAAREYLRKYSDRDDVGSYLKRWSEKYEEALVAWTKEKAKADLYQRILDGSKTDPKTAYEQAKEFLQKYPDDKSYAPSLGQWVKSYEAGEARELLRVEYGIPVMAGGTAGGAVGAAPERFYALVIGNSNYRFVSSLNTADEDAQAVGAVLRERYGFETTVLLDADRQQLTSALNSFTRETDEQSNLLIYFAGHGSYDQESDKCYWLPVDARPGDKAGWVGADSVTAMTRDIPARHVLVVADSCYSGTIYRAAGAAVSTAVGRDQFIEKVAERKSRTLLAGGANEPVEDAGVGHSVFAAALLRGLREMEPRSFTGAELFRDYVLESVAGKASQTPEYSALKNSGHDGGEFVFVRKQR
ncbi:MAG: caspase domain-containing protein [Pyrinomonadaceae bacterium]